VEGRLFLDIIVRERAAIFELFTSKDETLLVGRNALFVLNLGLYIVDGVRRFDLESDGFPGKSLDKNLHSTTETKDKMQGRLLLNVIIRKGTAILKLLSSKNETLLVGWDTLLVLNLCLDVVDRVRGFNFKSDGLSGQSLDEDLHTTTKTQDKVKSGLLLNIIVRKCAAVLKLLSGKDETLLVGRDSLLILDLCLDVVDSIGGLDLESDRLSSQSLDKDLHSSTQTKDKVKGRFLLNVVVGQCTTVFELLSSKDEALLVRRNSFLVLNFGLNIVDGIGRLDLKGDGFTREGLDKNLHTTAEAKNEVKGGLLLNIVIRKGTTIFELLPSEDQALLVRRDTKRYAISLS